MNTQAPSTLPHDPALTLEPTTRDRLHPRCPSPRPQKLPHMGIPPLAVLTLLRAHHGATVERRAGMVFRDVESGRQEQ